jgi:hypothetical protein
MNLAINYAVGNSMVSHSELFIFLLHTNNKLLIEFLLANRTFRFAITRYTWMDNQTTNDIIFPNIRNCCIIHFSFVDKLSHSGNNKKK